MARRNFVLHGTLLVLLPGYAAHCSKNRGVREEAVIHKIFGEMVENGDCFRSHF